MAVTFSFKAQKRIEAEKYNMPVLTKYEYTGEKKTVAKYSLNKAALKAFNFPDDLKGEKISIGRTDDDELVIAKTTDVQEVDNQFNVNKDGSFNSKFLTGKLVRFYGVDPVVPREFLLTPLNGENNMMIIDTKSPEGTGEELADAKSSLPPAEVQFEESIESMRSNEPVRGDYEPLTEIIDLDSSREQTITSSSTTSYAAPYATMEDESAGISFFNENPLNLD